MKVAFAGTPAFAALALERLLAAGFEVPLVLTQPDRPAGRGLKLQPSAVKQVALGHGIPVLQPLSLRLDGRYPSDAQSAQAALMACAPDVMVVAAYGLILPVWALTAPRLGCLNIHASLLPRWRGAAPIHRAIEAGDAQTGVCIMQMDAGLDTGAVLATEVVAITPDDTTPVLHDRLADVGASLLLQTLPRLAQGLLEARPQPAAGVTYAEKLDKAESVIDWGAPAPVIARRVRAFQPSPGTQTSWQGQVLKIWAAHEVPGPSAHGLAPGTVVALGPDGIVVQTGLGRLVLTELQRAGGRRMPVQAFLQGQALAVGDVLGVAGADEG